MTSMTSPSDTIRLRSRLSAAELGFCDTAELERPFAAASLSSVADRLTVIDDFQVIGRPRPDHEAALAGIVGPSRRTRLTVRLFDLSVAVVGLILLAPLMAMVAIAVMMDSPGPIVYGSPRVGHNRPSFRAWKFRSMHTDADNDLHHILANDTSARREYETYHKLHNDPRLTRVGAIIRQTSLDELPQLVNILLGQMSVVGPRPKLTQDTEAYGDALATVLLVKPGLTGLWQVSGRNLLPMADRVVLDLDYVANRSLLGDVAICIRTFVHLWRPGKHGAY